LEWLNISAQGRCDMSHDVSRPGAGGSQRSRREEIFAFVVLAVLIWPVLAVGIVGGYGFIVWMLQIIFGPPGPPGAAH
jgi:nitrate reductase NapE